jgi:hypothetical protein
VSMPGFSAEAAFSEARGHYRRTDTGASSFQVVPQQLRGSRFRGCPSPATCQKASALCGFEGIEASPPRGNWCWILDRCFQCNGFEV